MTPARPRNFARWRRALVMAVLLAASLSPKPGRAGSWQADLSVSFQKGDYGSTENTTMTSVPLTIKRVFGHGEVSVAVPFVSLKTEGSVLVVDGTLQAVAGGGGSASGLGDVVLKGKYYALEQQGPWPYIDLVGRVKLPTANDDLGSGEPDYGLGAELSYRFKGRFLALADAMYTISGDPPGSDYRNRIAWDVGVGWQPQPPWTLSLYFDSASSLRAAPAARSLMLYISRRVRPELRLYTLLEVGISDTAADLGLTAGVKYTF